MKTYDRADTKSEEHKEELRKNKAYFWEYEDLWDFFHDPYSPDITMDDVRRGWLFSFLIKLGLKSPKEKINQLRW